MKSHHVVAFLTAVASALASCGPAPPSNQDPNATTWTAPPTPWQPADLDENARRTLNGMRLDVPPCVMAVGCPAPARPLETCSPEVLAAASLTAEQASREIARLDGELVHIRGTLQVGMGCTLTWCSRCCNECTAQPEFALPSAPDRGASRLAIWGIPCKGDESGLCCPFGRFSRYALPGVVATDVIATGRLKKLLRELVGATNIMLVGTSDGAPTLCVPRPRGRAQRARPRLTRPRSTPKRR
jgi:hypothetical protein